MPVSVIRCLVCAPGGVASGIIGLLWAKLLLKRRKKEYNLSRKAELFLILISAVSGVFAGIMTSGYITSACALLLLCIGITISVTDTTNRIIPNPTVLAILLLKLAAGIPTLFGLRDFLPFDITSSIGGLLTCFAVFSLPSLFGKKIGAGDVKFAAAMGFILGFSYSLIAIVIMGLLVLAYGFLQRRMPILTYLKTSIPMGPFLAFGLYASFLLAAYL